MHHGGPSRTSGISRNLPTCATGMGLSLDQRITSTNKGDTAECNIYKFRLVGIVQNGDSSTLCSKIQLYMWRVRKLLREGSIWIAPPPNPFYLSIHAITM